MNNTKKPYCIALRTSKEQVHKIKAFSKNFAPLIKIHLGSINSTNIIIKRTDYVIHALGFSVVKSLFL